MINYFTKEEADMFTFIKIPKDFFTNETYKNISSDAKILYGILLDRNSLSLENKWFDEKGRVFIYFSREEVMELLGLSKTTVAKLFKELVDKELIDDVRQGLNKPNIIYVGKFITSKPLNSMEVQKIDFKESNISTSRKPKNGLQKDKKMDSINTYNNETEFIKTEKNTHTEKGNKSKKSNMCVELASQIETVVGQSTTQEVVKSLLKKADEETVKHYISIWDKYKGFEADSNNPLSWFIHCVSTKRPVPQPKANNSSYSNGKETFRDFDQRDYEESDFEKFYANLND